MRFVYNKLKGFITQQILMIFVIGLLVNLTLIEVTAEHNEFAVVEFNENYSIPKNKIQTIDFTFQEGNKLEIIYTIQVEDNLPIDIWFVDEDNNLLLNGGAQFLYFIDGSEQKTSYEKKFVTVTKHDNYKLVLTNYYNNQTINAAIEGEVRTYQEEVKDNSLNLIQISHYLLIVISIIFIVMTMVLSLKLHKTNRAKVLEFEKNAIKRKNSNKFKKNSRKNKRTKRTKSKNIKNENKKSSDPVNYCGYCGEIVNTPFCKKCGKKVK